jgi:hypothetical protein
MPTSGAEQGDAENAAGLAEPAILPTAQVHFHRAAGGPHPQDS